MSQEKFRCTRCQIIFLEEKPDYCIYCSTKLIERKEPLKNGEIVYLKSPYVSLTKSVQRRGKDMTTLQRIAAMCGNPDAAEGCRQILKVIEEATDYEERWNSFMSRYRQLSRNPISGSDLVMLLDEEIGEWE